MPTRVLSIAFFTIFLVPLTATAAEFVPQNTDAHKDSCRGPTKADICLTILLKGEILPGDAAKLQKTLTALSTSPAKVEVRVRIGAIMFDSPGGDVDESMKIGRIIRNELMWTQVTSDSVCYSACVLAFVGGVSRLVFGPVGIHSFYSSDFFGGASFDSASKQYNAAAKVVEAYLSDVRIPTSLLDEMRKVSHRSLKVLSGDELVRFAVVGIDPVYVQLQSRP